MIEFEGSLLTVPDAALAQVMLPPPGSTDDASLETLANSSDRPSDDAVLHDYSPRADDDWIFSLPSSTSPGAFADGTTGPGEVDLLDPQSGEGDEGGDIIITGRHYYDWALWDPDSGSGGSGSGGSSSGGSTAGNTGGYSTGVAPHIQDCGTEDGAATQAAKHVMGELPAGVAGPENPMTTATGNDWKKVEFGAVIVKNPDGSFGAFNNMIYSSNQATFVGLPNSSGQPVEGLWHSHPTRDDPGQRAIDRYPSPGDWNALARIGSQAGAVQDPSLWLTGPDGVTREFKLSERSSIESLSAEQMKNGDGLPGKERTQACG